MTCAFCESNGITGNPHPPIHPAWAGSEHVGWDDGYEAGAKAERERLRVALLSDEAAKANGREMWQSDPERFDAEDLDASRAALAAALEATMGESDGR